MAAKYNFDGVTLLITHYNRSSSLHRLLKTFKELDCKFTELVISDDGSKEDHLSVLKKLQLKFDFTLVTTQVNKGLGNNINKGQDKVKTEYTLYVQEDFVPTEKFCSNFAEAIQIMNERKDIDLVRFYAYFKYPHLKPFRNGFSEMIFNLKKAGYKKFYYYSDHPHLRRRNFLEKFGRYEEGKNPERTEYAMMMSFLQNKGKAMYYENFSELFVQLNSSAEPSSVQKNFWRTSENIFITFLREMYRHIRFNLDYLISR